MGFFPSLLVMVVICCSPARIEGGYGKRNILMLFLGWSQHICLSQVGSLTISTLNASQKHLYLANAWSSSIPGPSVFEFLLILCLYETDLKMERQSAMMRLESAKVNLSRVANELQSASSDAESTLGVYFFSIVGYRGNFV
jgi:hypothetical protein